MTKRIFTIVFTSLTNTVHVVQLFTKYTFFSEFNR